MKLPFTKMHGLGNDFILIDLFSKVDNFPNIDMERLSIKFCNRRFGIGADQLLILDKSKEADFKMKIYNADGGEVEMCGNGIRCLAKYVWDKGLSTNPILKIETMAGIIMPEKIGEMVRVDMGEPAFQPKLIPTNLLQESTDITCIIDYPLTILDRVFNVTCVSMGNPHTVIFLEEDITNFPVKTYGPIIEHHESFPKRTNVEFVNPKNDKELNMRVWERGSGETLACGTGAAAVAIAAMKKQLVERKVTVHLPGGELLIEWADNNHVFMTGPAVTVFEGTIDLSSLMPELL